MLSTDIPWHEVNITLLGPLQDLSRVATFDWGSAALAWYCLNSFVLIGFFFANWLWMFVLIALSFSADWLWISLPDWLLIHYLHCWWWFFFWISWRLVEVSFQHDHCIKSTLWFWKFITLSWGSVHSTNSNNFNFHDFHLFGIRKVRGVINHPMLRVYYLPSEELTFTLKFRENPLNKTCEHWALTDRILSI